MPRKLTELEQMIKTGAATPAEATPRRRLRTSVVEVTVTALILVGTVAAVVPQMTAGSDLTRSAQLRRTLHDLRIQVLRYRAEHDGVAPQYSGGFLEFPSNPMTGRGDVQVVAADEPFPAEATGATGWIYQPATGAIAANVPGVDGAGVRFFDY